MRQDREKPPTELTAPHRAMIALIQGLDIVVIAEYPVGKYTLDCYLPEFHAGVEVDGPGHSKSRDARRSDDISNSHGIPIIHFADVVIKQQPGSVCTYLLEFIEDFADSVQLRKTVAKEYERGHDA